MTGTRSGERSHLPLIAAISAALIVALLGVSWAVTGGSSRGEGGTTVSSRMLPPGRGGGGDPAPAGDPATTTTAAATTTTPASGPDELSLVFAGDLLPHGAVNDRAAANGSRIGKSYDYLPMFEPMRPVIEGADLAICHMEVPTVPEGEQVTTYPSFGAPPELAIAAGQAGYDGCSTASNHSLDRGRAGLDRLLDTFDQAGMQHTGTARTEDEGDGRAVVYDVDGVTIAHLSYAYDFNGYKIPADAPWSVNQIDPAKIIRRADEAKAAGADLVIVSLHWGTEYVHDPTDQQRAWAEEILATDSIDAIIGHHAHVVQPIGRVAGRFVVWGLGNQVSNQEQLPRRDGLTVRLRAARDDAGDWSVTGVEAIPTYVDLTDFRILPVVDTLRAGTESPAMDEALRASYERTAAILDRSPTEGVTLAPLP